MDPVSIIAAISVCAEVVKYTWKFSETLLQISKDPKSGNAATASLALVIRNLGSSCQLVEQQLQPIVATYEQIGSESDRTRLAQIWTGVERCAQDALQTLQELEKSVEGVSKEASNAVTQMWKNARLKLKQEDIDRFKRDISDHNTSLQISLQVLSIFLLYLAPQRVDSNISEKIDALSDLVSKADNPRSHPRERHDILTQARTAINDAETLYEASVADDMSVAPHARKVRDWVSGVRQHSIDGEDVAESLTLVEEEDDVTAAPYDEIDETHIAQITELLRQGNHFYDQRILDKAYKSFAQARTVEELLPVSKRTVCNNVTDRYRHAVTSWSNLKSSESSPILRRFYLSPAAQTQPYEAAHVGYLLAFALFDLCDLDSARAVGEEVMHATRSLGSSASIEYYQALAVLARILEAKGETTLADAYKSQIPAARANVVAGAPHAAKYWLQAWFDVYNVPLEDQVALAIAQGKYHVVARLVEATKSKPKGSSKYVDWMKPGGRAPKEGLSSAHLAAMSGNTDTLELVTSADPSVLQWPHYTMELSTPMGPKITWRGIKPIHLAAYLGHADVVRMLLAKEKFRTPGQDYTRTADGENAISFVLRKDDKRPPGFQTVKRCVRTLEVLWEAEAHDKEKRLRTIDGHGQHVVDLVYGNPLLLNPEVFRFLVANAAMRPHGKDDNSYYRRLISSSPTAAVVDCVKVLLESGDFAEQSSLDILVLAIKAYVNARGPVTADPTSVEEIKAYANGKSKIESSVAVDKGTADVSTAVIDLLLQHSLKEPWSNKYRPAAPIVIPLPAAISTEAARGLHELASKYDQVAIAQGPQGEWAEPRRVLIVGCDCADCSQSTARGLSMHYSAAGEWSTIDGCDCPRCVVSRVGPRRALADRRTRRTLAELGARGQVAAGVTPQSSFVSQPLERTNTSTSTLKQTVSSTSSSGEYVDSSIAGDTQNTANATRPTIATGLSHRSRHTERRLERHLQRLADRRERS